jgi:hypothetical protein
MTCTSDLGLFTGLWDGLTSLISLAMWIFWNVRVYDMCPHGWDYVVGFVIGVICLAYFGWVRFDLFLGFVFVFLIVKLVLFFIIYGIPVMILGGLAVLGGLVALRAFGGTMLRSRHTRTEERRTTIEGEYTVVEEEKR